MRKALLATGNEDKVRAREEEVKARSEMRKLLPTTTRCEGLVEPRDKEIGAFYNKMSTCRSSCDEGVQLVMQ